MGWRRVRHVFVQECDLDAILLHPRFAVVTEKADGTPKVRDLLIGPPYGPLFL